MVQRQKPDKTLADRVASFFERQIAWCGCVLDDLASVEAQLDEKGLDALEARRSVYDRDIAEQEKQLNALLAEWQDAPKPPAPELQRIRALARTAEECAARAAGELQRASAGTGAQAEEVRRNLQNLQNGRRAFSGYRQLQLDTGLLDEKA
ncbi:MAG TPA: hypothetical protein VMZ06_15700 [Candidatus Bathyarchaeia archaeon]|nr:hypothetical protein [Candidatus Bathyarchaeia archaeon]